MLSGGNLQRLILAREIDSAPKLLVAVQPTRGLDIGAIEGVHQLLLDLRAKGTAILLISEELEELLALADRILVMYEGRISASFDAPSAADDRCDRPPHDGRRRVIRLEPRGEAPVWLSPLLTVIALIVALLIGAFVLAFVGGDPIKAYRHIVEASFGNLGVLSDTLVKATPLILTGLACALAFRMRLWNIGAEGQFLLGAWGASAVVLFPLLPAGTPAIVTIPAMMVAGAAAGALWGLIPGVLRARLGVNEIITSLMLNYIALAWIQFWVFGPWSEGGFQQTAQFPREAWLPRLNDFGKQIPALSG